VCPGPLSPYLPVAPEDGARSVPAPVRQPLRSALYERD
jgi:hypothetical protein